jgi:hypothetical protein
MPLYDVTNKEQLVHPHDAASYDILVKARSVVGQRRFDKDIDIIDQALDELVERCSAENKLVFTKAGFLVGHSSALPHVDVEHVWKTAELAYPTHLLTGRSYDYAAELQLKLIGGLVRWRISLRPEQHWLVYRRPAGTFNKYTGKEITISEYWICTDYIPVTKIKKRATISDLVTKFNYAR